MKILKIAVLLIGGAIVLFVGTIIVLVSLDLTGVVNLEETGEQPEGDQRRGADDDKAGGRNRAGRKTRSSRRPLTRVTRIIDGDTVDTDKLDRVRLIGVDTPEEGRCYDTAATRFTERRLGGQVVGYELGVERKDRYGRTLAYLYRDENMHNFDLARRGYARVLTIPPNDKYAGRFRRAARRARRANVGVWGICERRVRRARAARRHRERERNRPSPPPVSLRGGSCLPSAACPGKRDGDGDGCYCE